MTLFALAVAKCHSIAGVLAALGQGVSGWNYRRVHKLVAELGTWRADQRRSLLS